MLKISLKSHFYCFSRMFFSLCRKFIIFILLKAIDEYAHKRLIWKNKCVTLSDWSLTPSSAHLFQAWLHFVPEHSFFLASSFDSYTSVHIVLVKLLPHISTYTFPPSCYCGAYLLTHCPGQIIDTFLLWCNANLSLLWHIPVFILFCYCFILDMEAEDYLMLKVLNEWGKWS